MKPPTAPAVPVVYHASTNSWRCVPTSHSTAINERDGLASLKPHLDSLAQLGVELGALRAVLLLKAALQAASTASRRVAAAAEGAGSAKGEFAANVALTRWLCIYRFDLQVHRRWCRSNKAACAYAHNRNSVCQAVGYSRNAAWLHAAGAGGEAVESRAEDARSLCKASQRSIPCKPGAPLPQLTRCSFRPVRTALMCCVVRKGAKRTSMPAAGLGSQCWSAAAMLVVTSLPDRGRRV